MPESKFTDTPQPLSDTPLDGGSPQVPDAQRSKYRSALLGVYLASRPPVALGLPPALRPMSLARSIDTIKRLEGETRNRATRVATAELCVGVYLRHRSDLRQSVVDLVGYKKADKLFGPKLESKQSSWSIKRAVYHMLDGDGSHEPLVDEEPEPVRQEDEPVTEPAWSEGEPIIGQPTGKRKSAKALSAPLTAVSQPVVTTDTELDVATMVTTVTARTVGRGDFNKLAKFVDPQSWTYSPFWREAYKVLLVGGRFIKDPNPPPLGTPWSGYFYEYVEWDWDGGIVSSFQNFLNIDFTVTPSAIDLTYSLYNCRGSLLYARIAEGGIDVDGGGYHAEPMPTILPRVSIEGDKSLRYTPLVSRSTAGQGTVLASELLNYMAPGIVGLWIDDLIYESTRLWENS